MGVVGRMGEWSEVGEVGGEDGRILSTYDEVVVFLLDGARVCVTLAHPAFSRCGAGVRTGTAEREGKVERRKQTRGGKRRRRRSRVLAAVCDVCIVVER